MTDALWLLRTHAGGQIRLATLGSLVAWISLLTIFQIRVRPDS